MTAILPETRELAALDFELMCDAETRTPFWGWKHCQNSADFIALVQCSDCEQLRQRLLCRDCLQYLLDKEPGDCTLCKARYVILYVIGEPLPL